MQLSKSVIRETTVYIMCNIASLRRFLYSLGNEVVKAQCGKQHQRLKCTVLDQIF